MSKMVSVHSLQSSRDPAGVDPTGADVIHGADPPPDEEYYQDPPILPPTSPAGPPPPTPRRIYSGSYGSRAPSPVMAFLVGDPPPPPPTPPPPRYRSAAARRHTGGPVSPPGDSSTTTGYSSLSSSIHDRREPRDPVETNGSGTSNLVDEKRRAALAIYESPNLYMGRHGDDDDDDEPELAPQPFHHLHRNHHHVVSNAAVTNTHLVEMERAENTPNPMLALASPRSAATEPHSNKRRTARRNSQRASSSQKSLDQESQQSADSTSKPGGKIKKSKSAGDTATANANTNASKKKRGRVSTGTTTITRGSKTPERRGRGRSVERQKRAETPEPEKRGFFRNLFRAGKKKLTDVENETNGTEVDMGKIAAPVGGGPPSKATTTKALPKVTFNDASVKPQGDGPSTATGKSATLEVDTSQKVMEMKPTSVLPANTDKELDLGLGLDTVTSGLTNDMEPDRREIFFAHDEVSTLTAPSAHSYGRRSIDPVEATVASGFSSEPIGHYWNDINKANSKATPKVATPMIDPFMEPFFQEPDGDSPITSNKGPNSIKKTNNKLQVHVSPTHDPAGETPRTRHSNSHMNEPSPRGWESPITELKDPLGTTISQPSSVHPLPGFGRQDSTQTPKLPPTTRSLTHELRREPSAFRDGSPYALDPPLHVFEDDEKDSKSLVDILSRSSPKGANNERVAVEPPTPTLSVRLNEVQPPTPSVRSVRSEQVEKNKPGCDLQPSPKGQKEQKFPTLADTIAERVQKTTNIVQTEQGDSSNAMTSTKKAKANTPGSPELTGFLDDLFEEKPSKESHKRPSIVIRPISINMTDSLATRSLMTKGETSPSKKDFPAQAIEIHRTQRLSGSPRSNKVEAGGVPPPPPVSPTRHNKRRVLLHSDEEKKEQDTSHTFTDIEESSSKSMLAALSTAACMNAKTVAYLHTLNGEPSPRHSWRRPDLSDDEYSPVKPELKKMAMSNVKAAMSKKHASVMCRTDEAAFDSFISSSPVQQAPPRLIGGRAKSAVGSNKPLHFQNAVSSAPTKAPSKTNSGYGKLSIAASTPSKPSRGIPDTRKSTPSKPASGIPDAVKNSKIQIPSKYGALSPRSRKAARENFKRPVYWFRFNRDVRVAGVPLAFGLDLLRKKREEDILNGLAIAPVHARKTKKRKGYKPSSSPYQPMSEEDIKDPIQRAGFRLLSKAAIPIQSSARRYLAHREATSRMQATIVLQSYFRRWKCEAFLRAYKHTCTRIQAAFRSWLVREEVAYENFNATQIQKIVRGYIAAAYVYDAIYWVCRLQAAMRGKLARLQYASLNELRQGSALQLQAWYRGCTTRHEADHRVKAIRTIQALYRSHSARVAYRVAVDDIILAQSSVRRLLARKELESRRLVLMNNAACKIQATWRGFQGYTDYIFALVDILVLQRSMRKWLAKKKVNSMRRHRAAIKIQSQWRRQQALIGMLYDLVHIIIAQSVIRRFLARKMLPLKRKQYSRRMKHQEKLDTAATKIQTAWRGFWGYSHFIIMQYEIIRLQAIVRGRASRILFSLKLGCCIMIQSAARRFIANTKTFKLKLARAALGAEVEGMRMKLACQRVQFWWRVVMECSTEKRAALVIERFFLMVKAEVDREIIRQSQIQTQTSQPQREKQPRKNGSAIDADEKLLERVWLNTVDEDHVDIFACTSQDANANGVANSKSSRSKSTPKLHQNPSYVSQPSREETPKMVTHHPSSPTMNLVMRHEHDPAIRRELELRARKEDALKASRRIQKSNPPPDVTFARSDERTEVSGITSPTVFNKTGKGKRTAMKSKKKFEDDFSLDEDSLLGEEIVDQKQEGGQSAPNQWSTNHRFFSDETDGMKKKSMDKHMARRHHSASSIASGSESSDLPSHMFSRTATTVTRTTESHSDTLESRSSLRSECNTDMVEKSYGSDRHLMSAASKGKKLIENVRKGSSTTGSKNRSGSPRHGRIVVTNRNVYPILSQDSCDNVEVEYVGQQFGMI